MNPHWWLTIPGLLLGAALSEAPKEEARKRPWGLDRVPSSASLRVSPYPADPGTIAGGGKLFARHCAECHGDHAQGGRKAPRLVSERLQGAASGSILWFVTNGNLRAGMPAWSRLPEAQRWQLVAFLKSLQDATAQLGPASQR